MMCAPSVLFFVVQLITPVVVLGFTQYQTTRQCTPSEPICMSLLEDNGDNDAPFVKAVPVDPTVVRLQKELLQLATATNRGFTASQQERKRAREIIYNLADYNPTTEPASPFYNSTTITNDDASPTLAGKWTLVYTDAPDITGLDAGGPLATAKLGRIGQECKPPYIKNVIEWQRPDWADFLPFAGTDESRVLQKVVTEASASPDKPLLVNLKLAGFEVTSPLSNSTMGNLQEDIQKVGLPAAWFSRNPIKLQGPLTAPFGQFEVLYLDDEFRIIKTGQNFLAVNVRNEQDWF
jgi:hypothetical protein